MNQEDFMSRIQQLDANQMAQDVNYSDEQLLSAFADMALSKEQKQAVLDYFHGRPGYDAFGEPQNTEKPEDDADTKDDVIELKSGPVLEEQNAILSSITGSDSEPVTERDLNHRIDVALGDAQDDEPYGQVGRIDSSDSEKKQRSEKALNSRYVKMYEQELEGIEPMAETELDHYYRALLQGDEEAIETVVNQNLSMVFNRMKHYASYPVKMEDVIGEGNLALFMSVKGLCGKNKQMDVADYLEDQVKKAMEQYIDETLDSSDWAEMVVQRARLLDQAKQVLTEDLVRTPTVKELADYTRISEEEIAEIENLTKEKIHTAGEE